jgi:hypothetical protein
VRATDPRQDIRRILVMLASIGLPAMLTLSTVRASPRYGHEDANPTPLGYTVSLLIFLVPLLVLFGWHFRHGKGTTSRRALIWSTIGVAVIGFVLDLGFAHSFFTYRNTGATLGIRVAGWSFGDMQWVRDYIPVEEFAFYILGALFMITMYVWADVDWMPAYSPKEFDARAKEQPRLIHLSGVAAAFWLLVAVLGLAVKRYGPNPDGIPGYFLFLMVLGFLPTFLCIKGVAPFVNWRAFAYSYSILLFIELLYETTLGVPYDWWNYKREHMLGIHLTAWSDLPIEAVLLWMVVAWDCVIAFEVCRVFLHMDRKATEALFGHRALRRSRGAG